MIERQDIVGQGLRYVLTGGLAAVLDIGAFSVLYPRFVAQLWLGAALSFLVAAAFNYTASSLFVFRAGPLSLQRGAYFLLAASLGLLINASVTAAVAAVTGAEPVVAKCVGVGIAFLFNFMANRQLVFGSAARNFVGEAARTIGNARPVLSARAPPGGRAQEQAGRRSPSGEVTSCQPSTHGYRASRRKPAETTTTSE